MIQIVFIIAVVAILMFIYINRSVNQKRDERRVDKLARRQELFDRTLEQVKKGDHDSLAEKKMDD